MSILIRKSGGASGGWKIEGTYWRDRHNLGLGSLGRDDRGEYKRKRQKGRESPIDKSRLFTLNGADHGTDSSGFSDHYAFGERKCTLIKFPIPP